MQQPIKLVAIDMDGTLFNSQHEISPRNLEALRKAIAQGVHVILATGRPRNEHTIAVIELLELTTPGIFLQGLMVHNADGSLRVEVHFDPAVARPVIEMAEARGYTILAYAGARMLTGIRTATTDLFIGFGEAEPEAVGSLLNILELHPFNKLVFVHDPEQIQELRSELEAVLQGQAQVIQSLPESIEIIPRGISKGAALQHLMEEYSLTPENVMAIGDGENDVEMIRLAGIGVAMGNALPAAKAAADFITATNNEDGVAQALEKFVLNGHSDHR